MAIAKVCGIETEYGILVRGAEVNPVTASSMLISTYVDHHQRHAGWDFHGEHPLSDARGFRADDLLDPAIESAMVNAVLTNGARYYVDHAHPEISTPECRTALDVVLYDRAAEEVIRRSMALVGDLLPDGAEMLCHKNNSDGKGNSYGCHENYLVAREVPFARIVHQLTPHFVSRQVVVGAGKVGCEAPGTTSREVPFQLSQRADFIEEEVGLETTLKRPIINTRDEPHCDPTKYRRLHVILGDANMSEVATFVKVGATAIVLAMIEDDGLGDDLRLADPVRAIRMLSHDPSLQRMVPLADGRAMSALDIQEALFEKAIAWSERHGLASVGEDSGAAVLREWGEILAGLRYDPLCMADRVDWVAKKRLVDAYARRDGLGPTDVRLKALDFQYHDLRKERCLADRVGLRTLVHPAAASRAISEPPDDTRAYFRGRCLQKWPTDIVAINWDGIVFDVGHDTLRRVPMMEPLRGTAAHVGRLIDESDVPADLLARLGA